MWQSCDYQSTCGGLNNTVRHRNTVQSLLNHQSYLKKREKQSKVGKFAKLVSHKSIGIEYEVTSWSLPGGVERELKQQQLEWSHMSSPVPYDSLKLLDLGIWRENTEVLQVKDVLCSNVLTSPGPHAFWTRLWATAAPVFTASTATASASVRAHVSLWRHL